jgi:nucleoside-diphosphate-sugar epimerase
LDDGISAALHLAHVRYTGTLLAALGPQVTRVVVVSSQRGYSRVPSASVCQVREGEQQARSGGERVVLLRPSMIYGPADDRNLTRLAAFLGRCRWLPVFGDGQALQQPVHVDDVIAALLAALIRPAAAGRQYDLAGPRPMTYNELVDAVGRAVGVRPRPCHIPVGAALTAARLVPLAWGQRVGLVAEQILRLQEDKTASIVAATADLGFDPMGLAEGLAQVHGRGPARPGASPADAGSARVPGQASGD